MADLQGPKIRVGKIPDPGIELPIGADVVLSHLASPTFNPSHETILLNSEYPRLAEEVRPGHRVLINDGAIRLMAIEREPGDDDSILRCRVIVPGLVTLFIWKFFFDANFGVLNRILDATGLKLLLIDLDNVFHWGVFHADAPVAWLSQPELIIPSLILWGFPWIGTVGVLIYLAGLQAIGNEIYEAADLDGVNGFQKFVHIELPLILTQIRLTLVLLIIGTLQGYGLQFLLLGENGGAGGRGMVPGLWMFNRAFIAGEFGYACAIGMTLFVFILLLTYLNNKYVRIQK
jgi:ABC-type sugar transport system permease subunit